MNFIIWLILWFVFMGMYYLVFRKKRILYKNNSLILGSWYLSGTIITFFYFKTLLIEYFSKTTKEPFLLLGFITLGFALFSFFYTLQRLRTTKESIHSWISKTTEVLFQEIMVATLCLLLFHLTGENFRDSVILFWGIFFIVHLPMYAFFTKEKASLYTGGAIIGGSIIGMLILSSPYGILFSATLHMFFYTLLALRKDQFREY